MGRNFTNLIKQKPTHLKQPPNLFRWCYMLFIFFIFSANSLQSQITSVKDNIWNLDESWDESIPTANDSVIIDSELTIQAGTKAEAKGLHISKSGKLIIEGTLIIHGNLTMENNGSELQTGTAATVIIFGDAILDNKVVIDLSSYFIVQGNFLRDGADNQGNISVKEAHIYVFGEISSSWNDFTACESGKYDGTTALETDDCDAGQLDDFVDNVDPKELPDGIYDELVGCDPPTATISGDADICEGEPATITVDLTGTPDWNLTFQLDGTNYLSVENIPSSPYTFNVSQPGTYTVSAVSDANCRGTTSGSATVAIESTPVACTLAKTPDETSVCEGTDVSASLTAASGGNGSDELEYRTNNGTDWTNWATYASETNISTTGLAGVEIRTRRLADFCNHSDYNTVSWTVNPLPSINLTSFSAALCHGELVAYLSYSSATGDIYSIDFNATAEGQGFADTGGSLTGSEIEITIPESAQPDTYSAELTVTNSTTGCISEVYNITITIYPLPATGEIIPD